MSDSGSGGGGATKVPISGTVDALGQTTYNNQTCDKYSVQISSSNGQAQAVTLSVSPGGVSVDPYGMSVPAVGYQTCYVYVPTSITGTVTLTVSETGFTQPSTVTVRA